MVMKYTSYLCIAISSHKIPFSKSLINYHAFIIAFMCISEGKQFKILEEISQAEVYTSVNIRHVLTTCHYTMITIFNF